MTDRRWTIAEGESLKSRGSRRRTTHDQVLKGISLSVISRMFRFEPRQGMGERGVVVKMGEKIALITGAGAGDGRGLVRGFARAGAHVLIADIDADAAESVAALVRAKGRHA